jgi:hypothetical protein
MEFIPFIREFGLPVAALCAIAYGSWHIAQWIGTQVVIPLRDRHFAFLASLEATLDAIARTQSQMVQEIERVSTACRNGVTK